MGAGVVGILIGGLIASAIYGLFGWIFTAIFCALYNWVAGFTGGVEFELKAAPTVTGRSPCLAQPRTPGRNPADERPAYSIGPRAFRSVRGRSTLQAVTGASVLTIATKGSITRRRCRRSWASPSWLGCFRPPSRCCGRPQRVLRARSDGDLGDRLRALDELVTHGSIEPEEYEQAQSALLRET